MGNGGSGGLGSSPALLPLGVGACVLTTTEGQVWNPYPGPGTRPPAGLAGPLPVSSAPPHRPDAKRLLGYHRPLSLRGMMTKRLLPVPWRLPPAGVRLVGKSSWPIWGLRAKAAGWALQGMCPNLASPRSPELPYTLPSRPDGRGSRDRPMWAGGGGSCLVVEV